jgi:hypothetical protein
MLKTFLVGMLSLLLLLSSVSGQMVTGSSQKAPQGSTGTLERMIVANGNVSMNLDLNLLNGTGSSAKGAQPAELKFDTERDAFFTVMVFNDELRGPTPSSMNLVPLTFAEVPASLNNSMHQLVLEKTAWGEQYELVVRDGRTGYIFFNIEGQNYDYDASSHALGINDGRLLLSKQFAVDLGRAGDAGAVVGKIAVNANLRDVEVVKLVNDEVTADTLPPIPNAGSVPGPDVIVGDLNGLSQPDSGVVNGQVGISVGTDSCNLGVVNLDWFQTPDNDHPVIPQNLYRMSGGASNNDTIEQIGQSSVKHAFTALTENICSLGCNGTGGTHLGSGCSDPYVVSLNSGGSTHNLGSRAWINPFTGAFPRADGATPPNSHSGHSHNAVSHRMVVNVTDLNTTTNPGATYFAEAQYITPHEYVWCQAHPGECNMYNNASYRQYSVTGTAGPFSFTPVGNTQRAKPAISAWTGSTQVQIQPDAANDGIGIVAYKVTNPSAGVWHYEYAIFNQNLDRAIQSFSVPVGSGVTVSNVGFHAPPQQPAWAADGTVGSTGFSNAPWTQTSGAGFMAWGSETFAQNPNANAIRWGTMYNIRFDSNRPPTAMNATVGFLKTGAPLNVAVQGPSPATVVNNLTLSGQVFTAGGNPIRNATVVISDQQGGGIQYSLTSNFGYFGFSNLTAGVTYTISVASKRYTFNPLTMQVNDNVTGANLTAQPDAGRSSLRHH